MEPDVTHRLNAGHVKGVQLQLGPDERLTDLLAEFDDLLQQRLCHEVFAQEHHGVGVAIYDVDVVKLLLQGLFEGSVGDPRGIGEADVYVRVVQDAGLAVGQSSYGDKYPLVDRLEDLVFLPVLLALRGEEVDDRRQNPHLLPSDQLVVPR